MGIGYWILMDMELWIVDCGVYVDEKKGHRRGQRGTKDMQKHVQKTTKMTEILQTHKNIQTYQSCPNNM